MPEDKDSKFMRAAIGEALKAYDIQEVPIGAVVVCNDMIIARAHNMTEKLNDPTAHAEMQAITAATNWLGGKYLNDCTVYVTTEPCAMCAAALGWSQAGRIVYGAGDNRKGFTLIKDNLLHPKTRLTSGVLGDECGKLMKKFFRAKRRSSSQANI